jgi:hypothetical protein
MCNRFVDGRVAEHWFQMDSLTLLQQLGLVRRARPAVAAAGRGPSAEEAAGGNLTRKRL